MNPRLVLALSLLPVLFATSASAADGQAMSADLSRWSDDFSDPETIRKNWSVYSFRRALEGETPGMRLVLGEAAMDKEYWSVVDGSLLSQAFPANPHPAGIQRKIEGRDFRVRLRFQLPEHPSAKLGITLWGVNPVLGPNPTHPEGTPFRDYFWLGGVAVTKSQVWGADNITRHPKGSAAATNLKAEGKWNRRVKPGRKMPLSLDANVWHSLRLECRGRDFTVWINGERVYDYRPSCGGLPKKLLSLGAGILKPPHVLQTRFDDIVVEPLEPHPDDAWTTVANPGNAPDARTGFGAVATPFQIMRHEVTNREYAEFLNAVATETDPHGLWNEHMETGEIFDLNQSAIRPGFPKGIARSGEEGSWRYECMEGAGEKPVVWVSFLDAMRYANWVHHGKGDGDTETGAYDLSRGGLAPREPGARVWIPSEDEWYKAAYHHPRNLGGPVGDYWLFSPALVGEAENSGTRFRPFLTPRTSAENSTASILSAACPMPRATTTPTTNAANVWEWTEGIRFDRQRVMRGGSAAHSWQKLQATVRSNARSRKRISGHRLSAGAVPI